MRKTAKTLVVLTVAIALGATYLFQRKDFLGSEKEPSLILSELAAIRSFDIEIHTVGELEAQRSTSITSSIKGDLAKIIYLVADGLSVKANETLVKLDATPFEEHVEELKRLMRDQESKIIILERVLKWESDQVKYEKMAAEIEVEAAKLEINKMIHGDGPTEEAHLKSAMQKALAKFEELKGYAEDLIDLETQGFINKVELKQAEKKLEGEEEAYQSALMQYQIFKDYTLPMQIKKAKSVLQRCENKYEEVLKSGAFKVAKAEAQLEQAKQEMTDLSTQLKNAEQQMLLTEIKAPTPGMVVLKEEYRNGQKRKPRLGDILIRNQPILDLPDLDTMLVKTKVREIDLFKIKEDTPATIEMDAYPELRFNGRIKSIGVLAVSDVTKTGDEKYFELIVKIDESDSRLRPGMTARVTLHADRVADKLTIPIQAVFEFNKQFYCFVPQDNRYMAVPIKLGLNNQQWIEIRAGLDEILPVLLSMPAWADIKNSDIIAGKNDVSG